MCDTLNLRLFIHTMQTFCFDCSYFRPIIPQRIYCMNNLHLCWHFGPSASLSG